MELVKNELIIIQHKISKDDYDNIINQMNLYIEKPDDIFIQDIGDILFDVKELLSDNEYKTIIESSSLSQDKRARTLNVCLYIY